jgi:hypothetical protein
MTVFGWIYLVLTILGAFNTITEIGKPRKPVSQSEAAVKLLTSGLLFWALYAWGLQ